MSDEFISLSGNVFADFGLEQPEEELLKVDLALRVNKAIDRLRLTQTAAAERLGIRQPNVSALRRYKLSGFSSERLLHFLTRLGCLVRIEVGGPGVCVANPVCVIDDGFATPRVRPVLVSGSASSVRHSAYGRHSQTFRSGEAGDFSTASWTPGKGGLPAWGLGKS